MLYCSIQYFLSFFIGHRNSANELGANNLRDEHANAHGMQIDMIDDRLWANLRAGIYLKGHLFLDGATSNQNRQRDGKSSTAVVYVQRRNV